MNESIVYLAYLCGGLSGFILFDYSSRVVDKRNRLKDKDELKKVLSTLSDTHNNVIEQLKKIGDRINAHEFMLKSKSDDKNPVQGISGKRF